MSGLSLSHRPIQREKGQPPDIQAALASSIVMVTSVTVLSSSIVQKAGK